MLLLAADTSGKHGSIALARVQAGGNCEVIEIVPLAGGTFSAQLVPQVAALLAQHEFTKADLGAFAVASGPGSFTGLRVGLAAIKAFGEVLKKPIAAISLLEALALAAGKVGKVMAVLDAGRGQAYAGEYEVTADSAQLIRERLLERAELREAAAEYTALTPDGDIAEFLRGAGLRVQEVERPRSDLIARLGWKKIQAGQTVSPEELEANYIRRSDAEIFSKPR